jgi:hypothetical protein
MATQPIDLGSTTAVNFNGQPVEKINLDGTEIWSSSFGCTTCTSSSWLSVMAGDGMGGLPVGCVTQMLSFGILGANSVGGLNNDNNYTQGLQLYNKDGVIWLVKAVISAYGNSTGLVDCQGNDSINDDRLVEATQKYRLSSGANQYTILEPAYNGGSFTSSVGTTSYGLGFADDCIAKYSQGSPSAVFFLIGELQPDFSVTNTPPSGYTASFLFAKYSMANYYYYVQSGGSITYTEGFSLVASDSGAAPVGVAVTNPNSQGGTFTGTISENPYTGSANAIYPATWGTKSDTFGSFTYSNGFSSCASNNYFKPCGDNNSYISW